MLLYIYLGSTAAIWIEEIAHHIILRKKLKKEGYKYTGNNYFGLADILLGLFYIGALSVPGLNLAFLLSHLNIERSYDEYKNYLEEAGAIEKIDDVVIDENAVKKVENIINNELTKNKVTVNNTSLTERVNRNGHIYYSSTNHFDNEPFEEIVDEEKGHVYKKEFFKSRYK